MIYSFAPIIDEQCKILILGSMPSVKSLAQGEYYGNRQNYFWPMMFELFGKPYSADYQKKQELLLTQHIALWDVLRSCEREGSLDSQIKGEQPNDIEALLRDYPQIEAILLNGGKAAQSFKRYFPHIYEQRPCYQMPSTSPAHTMRRSEKLAKWRIIINLLHDESEEGE